MPFSGVSPYTGPWGYHPGWGRGGNSLPVEENYTGPSQSAPPRSGSSRGERTGRAQAWGGDPKHYFPQVSTHTLLSCTPPLPRLRRSSPALPAGAVQVISPERRIRGSSSGYTLPRHLPMHRTVGVLPGVGPGREPPPRRGEPYWPSPRGPRAGAGALVVRAGEGRKPGEATQNTIFHRYLPIHCSHVPHPSRASRSSPARGGSAGDIPGKAGPGKQPRLYPSSASPHAPDRGDITRGGAGEGTPSPSTKTILALLNVPRAGAGAFVVRSQDGCSQKSEPGYRSPPPPPLPRFALLPRPRRGPCR